MYWHSFIHASIHSRHHTVTVSLSMCTVLNTIVRRLNTRVINFSVNVHHQSCLCLCVLCSVWTMKAYGWGLLMRHFFRMSEAMRWSVRTVSRYLPCHANDMVSCLFTSAVSANECWMDGNGNGTRKATFIEVVSRVLRTRRYFAVHMRRNVRQPVACTHF